MQMYDDLYQQLTTAAQRAYTRGIQTGSGGNLSARVPESEQMIVKSSGGSFADCDHLGNGFILTDFTGEKVEDVPGKPTREAFLQRIDLPTFSKNWWGDAFS